MAKLNFSNGDQIYKYALQNRIGGGHFGDVWLANDNAIAQPLAIKIIDATNTSIDQELLEARIGNRMNHENLVRVHSADIVKIGSNDVVIIAMDFVQEGSITSKACSGNFVDIRMSMKAMIDVLRGLEFLHDAGFYHNDIKPHNILIGEQGEGLLTDYGIAEITSDGKAIKPKSQYQPHKAPETFSSHLIDAKSDVYQCGLALFRLVNGLNLISDTFTSHTPAEYSALVKSGGLLAKAGWQPFVPSMLKRIIRKATDCDTDKRYSSALEMRRALEKLMYPGAWSCTATGDFQGECGKYTYRFEITTAKKHNLIAYKKNAQNGRETKISAFCKTGLSSPQLLSAKSRFMKAVVEGKA